MKRTPATHIDSRALGAIVAFLVVAALFFAKEIFIPLALAWLLTLILTPVVGVLENLRLPRVLAVAVVVVVLVASLGLLGWKTSAQFIDLTNQLSTYRKTLQDKIHAVHGMNTQSISKASDTMKELGKELAGGAPEQVAKDGKKPAPGTSAAQPMAVEVVAASNPLDSAQHFLGPLLTAGMVVIFTIFMLVGREDLRNRFLRLAGGSRLNAMTQALDDATRRVNRYLLLQSMVNVCYGLCVAGALYVIGVPNAVLWGVSAAILRYLPYIGPPMAATLPILLSLAVFPGWHGALKTMAVFFVLEVTVSNFVEPLLYGAHVGLTGLAILVAAVFWTFVWGFPGLVLSTPLTVCLVVFARYVPHLAFLNVLLGDEPVLPPSAQVYQRLLAGDQAEARQILEQYLKDKSLEELYTDVVIPALGLAEQDRHRNELDEDTQNFIYQSARELIEELGLHAQEQDDQEPPAAAGDAHSAPLTHDEGGPRSHILCLPARDTADDVVALLLCQTLERRGHIAQSLQIGATSEMLAQLKDSKANLACISALPPFAVEHARTLYRRIRAQSPDLPVIICLWHFEGDVQKATLRLKLSPGDALLTSLPQILQYVETRLHTAAPAIAQ